MLKLFAIWPVGANGSVVMVVAKNELDATCWLEYFFGESIADMVKAARADGFLDNDTLCIVEHKIEDGVIFDQTHGSGIPMFHAPHAAI